MSCTFSKELLALHIENDLADSEERIVAMHLRNCGECRQFLEQLGNRQSQLKMLRREVIASSAFASMRRDVMSQIESTPQALGWALRIERLLFLGFRQHAVIFASVAAAAVISVTLFAQMRQMPAERPVAVFAGSDTLIRPDGYREWMSIGSSSTSGEGMGPHKIANASAGSARNVYIDRSAYREFANTGRFPEGTVLIREIFAPADPRPIALEASVKDERFDGGWGFFDFASSDGTIADRAQSIIDKSRCLTCHEERARFDHVFTQVHPGLKTAT